MTKVHVISDLFLGFNEFADKLDETIPDVDLVILNGNIGRLKRGMLYAESLANKYPEIAFVYNLGYLEKYDFSLDKSETEVSESLNVRKSTNQSWPKNLHWSDESFVIKLRNGFQVDILTKFGFPKIHKCHIDWKDTFYYRNIPLKYTYYEFDERISLPKNASLVGHGNYPIWATQELVNEKHEEELAVMRKWENTPSHYKILITHINPYNDDRNFGLTVTPHRIHMHDMLWVTSNTKVENLKFLGSRLVSNPGRGVLPRSHIINI